MRFRLHCIKESIQIFLLFLKYLPGYYKLHRNYEYEPDTYDFIIDNYETVLCERTKFLSKPTYCWRTVVDQLDRYYEKIYEEKSNERTL